jgi:hypothetical protein
MFAGFPLEGYSEVKTYLMDYNCGSQSNKELQEL